MRFFLTAKAIIVLFLIGGCSGSPATLKPEGPAAASISQLSWMLIGLGSIVYIAVCGFLLLALFRRSQKEDKADAGDRATGSGIVLWGGIIIPTAILLFVMVLTVRTLIQLSETAQQSELTIDVIGNQWWWEIHYPDQGVTTANEIHIPTGQAVRINLTAQGVIHSFWVPQLHGKLDMVPGQTNTMHIQADTPGEYRGICAEFCGIQHARMLFLIVAEPPDVFATWLEAQRLSAVEPQDELARRGKEVFFDSTCDQCHAIAGTEATGRLGPDLTHFASRREIAAGTLINNRGNLAGWIAGPQELKPGNLMPATVLPGPDLQALLTYLESLR